MDTEQTKPVASCAISSQTIRHALEDRYVHWRGTPRHAMSGYYLPIAWRMHFEGYLKSGLAKPAAEDPDGYLLPHIDKTRQRTEGIEYFLAMSPADHGEGSTVRLITAEDPRDLPTYSLIREGMSSGEVRTLRDFIDGGGRLIEIGALAKSARAHKSDPRSISVAELIRKILGHTIGKRTILYFSMVAEVRDALAKLICPANLTPIGHPVKLEPDHYRRETVLIPIVIEPDRFIGNILDAVNNARDGEQKKAMLHSLLFFSHQLDREHVPDEVQHIRDRALATVTPRVQVYT